MVTLPKAAATPLIEYDSRPHCGLLYVKGDMTISVVASVVTIKLVIELYQVPPDMTFPLEQSTTVIVVT